MNTATTMTKKEFFERLIDSLAAFYSGKTCTVGMWRLANKILRHFSDVFELDFEISATELSEIVRAAKLQVKISNDMR